MSTSVGNPLSTAVASDIGETFIIFFINNLNN